MSNKIVLPSREETIKKLCSLGLVDDNDMKLINKIGKNAGKEKGVKEFVSMFADEIAEIYKSPFSFLTMIMFINDFTKALTDDDEFIELVRQSVNSLYKQLHIKILGG